MLRPRFTREVLRDLNKIAACYNHVAGAMAILMEAFEKKNRHCYVEIGRVSESFLKEQLDNHSKRAAAGKAHNTSLLRDRLDMTSAPFLGNIQGQPNYAALADARYEGEYPR